MMGKQVSVITLAAGQPDFPGQLAQVVQPAVDQLYIWCRSLDVWRDILTRPRLAIVGSRKMSAYGRLVTHQLACGTARAGAVVVSGLAYGVDACAHAAALEVGGQTIAVLPSSVEEVYPRGHSALARQIVEQDGAVISEYPPGSVPYPMNFIARNRIIAGLAGALVVTEAAAKSGSLHTARFALEQGIDVLAVPGNIDSKTSQGTNELLKHGAGAVTDVDDLLRVLGVPALKAQKSAPHSNDPNEQCLLTLLSAGISDGADLLEHSGLNVQTYQQTLTMLEITGVIRPLGGNIWQLA